MARSWSEAVLACTSFTWTSGFFEGELSWVGRVNVVKSVKADLYRGLSIQVHASHVRTSFRPHFMSQWALIKNLTCICCWQRPPMHGSDDILIVYFSLSHDASTSTQSANLTCQHRGQSAVNFFLWWFVSTESNLDLIGWLHQPVLACFDSYAASCGSSSWAHYCRLIAWV